MCVDKLADKGGGRGRVKNWQKFADGLMDGPQGDAPFLTRYQRGCPAKGRASGYY